MALPNITIGDMISFAVSRTLPRLFPISTPTCWATRSGALGPSTWACGRDTDRGLLVPTLFGAERMSLSANAGRSKELAAACRGGSISPERAVGRDLYRDQLGTLGIEDVHRSSTRPRLAILGVCAITYRPRRGKGWGPLNSIRPWACR
jgi:pyruvate dehydrogenase E2 component (dihydrolipoamide acetyltransferase)